MATSIDGARDVIGHYHASEPNLAPIGASSGHAEAGRALAEVGYANWVSIEMRAAGDNVEAVAGAVARVKEDYGGVLR